MKTISKDRRVAPAIEIARPQDLKNGCSIGPRFDPKAAMTLATLLGFFLLLQSFMPLRTAVQIGADEGFELAKATLCLNGHKLYSEVWNDQPPLHTCLISWTLKHISPSIVGPRLITVVFAALLLACVFCMSLRLNGLLVAGVTTALLIASPGFLELSCSCMLEIPALAPALAALALLLIGRKRKPRGAEFVAGALFGAALAMKLVPVILLPVAAMAVWAGERQTGHRIVNTAKSLALIAVGMALGFIAIDGLVDGGAFLTHIRQTWVSHFAPAKSFEYGSPADHPFEWEILLRNWDTTVPAVVGIILVLRQARSDLAAALPAAWLALMLGVFTLHRPWWSYYYVHLAIPLSWCAAIGLVTIGRLGRSQATRRIVTFLVVCSLGMWLSGRAYLQIKSVRESPQTYSSPVLNIMRRFKPFTQWLYTEDPVYSFHCGVPLVPDLGVVMLKRFWSGEMTNAKIEAELRIAQPEMLLLMSDTNPRAFRDLIATEYRLVYQDPSHRLYIRNSIADKVDL